MDDLILKVGAICLALAAIGVVARVVWNAWRRVDAFLEDWNGEPARPGREGRPSMPERMAKVERQITPNGGDTLNLGDRVVRLERHFGTEPDKPK